MFDRRLFLAGGVSALTAGCFPMVEDRYANYRFERYLKSKGARPNILFISIDDLNDWIEPLGGHPDIRTPNMTALAKAGCVFENAFASVAQCLPSRVSVLFGRPPSVTGIYHNNQAGADYPTVLSLPALLRKRGYTVAGAGKIFPGWSDNHYGDWHAYNWDSSYFETDNASAPLAQAPAQYRIGNAAYTHNFGPADPGQEFSDLRTYRWIKEKLPELKNKEPFFVAAGIYKPHLNWVVPKEFFDLYKSPSPPPGYFEGDDNDLPPEALEIIGPDKFYTRIKKFGEYEQFIRGYMAAISFADHVVGKILSAFEEHGLMDNTIVVLWSDHGYQLGEKMKIKKHSLWERALRSPLIISGPGISPRRIAEPVSLIDIFPTIVEMAKAPLPNRFKKNNWGVSHGRALFGARPISRPVYSFWNQPGRGLSWSVRDDNWRYIQYWAGGEELYDHSNDPFEIDNLAAERLKRTQHFREMAPRMIQPRERRAAEEL